MIIFRPCDVYNQCMSIVWCHALKERNANHLSTPTLSVLRKQILRSTSHGIGPANAAQCTLRIKPLHVLRLCSQYFANRSISFSATNPRRSACQRNRSPQGGRPHVLCV